MIEKKKKNQLQQASAFWTLEIAYRADKYTDLGSLRIWKIQKEQFQRKQQVKTLL